MGFEPAPPAGDHPPRGPGRRALGALAALGVLPRRGVAAAPVGLLIGGAPGSAADTWARGFAPFLERHLPRAAVAVVNRPGEAGLAAVRAIAAAPPDGRLIAAVAVPRLLSRAIEVRAEDLLARLGFLAVVAEEPLVLVGQAGRLDDLDALRSLGRQPVLGTPPHGSAAQLAALALGGSLDFDLLPFASAPAARQAVLAGHIAGALLPLPEAIAALRDGRLSGLGLAQPERSDLLPEVATFTEQGIPLQIAAYRGFAVPAGIDPAVVLPLVAALKAVVVDPEYAAQAHAQGIIPRFIGQAAWEPMLRRMLAELGARWSKDPWTARHD
ncbi:hypothetical protein E2C06_03070 [Dankookia rubra]|uniref:Tripartite tricarboxylate transporter substrate binding protein n=1 Tax=Dankookia rubra TaxID=1442381 RepID=A0A4R5QLE7_9PROT|nr:tripartite tricarboxylate transporter substrate-binding protein [Dankookia rubra]TDH64332.1 hypothetical protein E2C06_03070 [Dankookia rubra]